MRENNETVLTGTLVKTDNGIIGQMKADWILPEDKKLEVTLKILEKDAYQRVFYCF